MPSSACKKCARSEEHTSELQSHDNLVCRLLLEKKKYDSVHTSEEGWHNALRPVGGHGPCARRSRAGSRRSVHGGSEGSASRYAFVFFLNNAPPPNFTPFPPRPPFPS